MDLIRYNNGIYAGQFDEQQQVKEGVGFIVWDNGDLYLGEFKKDEMDGKGLLILSENNIQIIGNFKDNKLNGLCYINLRTEEIFCDFLKGIVSNRTTVLKYFKEYDITFQMNYDQGILQNVVNIEQGRQIINRFKEFQDFNTQLKFLRSFIETQKFIQLFKIENNTFYAGQSKDGLPNGFGLFVFSDGKCHIAQYQQGIVNGFGIIDFQNGDKYRGQINQDLFNNLGYFFNQKQKGYYIGQFNNGKCQNPIVNGEDNKEIQRQVIKQYFEKLSNIHINKSLKTNIFIKLQMPLCEDLQKIFSKQLRLDSNYILKQFDYGFRFKKIQNSQQTSPQKSHQNQQNNLDLSLSNYKVTTKSTKKQQVILNSDQNIKNYIFTGGKQESILVDRNINNQNSFIKMKVIQQNQKLKNEELEGKLNNLRISNDLLIQKNKTLSSFKNIQNDEDFMQLKIQEQSEQEQYQQDQNYNLNDEDENETNEIKIIDQSRQIQNKQEQYVQLLEEKLHQQQDQIEKLEKIIEQKNEFINEQLIKYQEKEKLLMFQNSRLNDENSNYIKQFKQDQNFIQELSNHYQISQDNINNLQATLNNQEQINQQNQIHIQSQQLKIEQSFHKINEINIQKDANNEIIKQLQQQIDNQIIQIQLLNQENQQLKNINQQLLNNNNEINTKLQQELKNQQNNVLNTYNQMQHQLHLLQNQNNQLELQNKQTKEQNDNLIAENQKLEQLNELSNKEIKQIKEQIQSFQNGFYSIFIQKQDENNYLQIEIQQEYTKLLQMFECFNKDLNKKTIEELIQEHDKLFKIKNEYFNKQQQIKQNEIKGNEQLIQIINQLENYQNELEQIIKQKQKEDISSEITTQKKEQERKDISVNGLNKYLDDTISKSQQKRQKIQNGNINETANDQSKNSKNNILMNESQLQWDSVLINYPSLQRHQTRYYRINHNIQ